MSSIKKNFLYNLIYQILLIILPLITTPYISRVLGADGVGAYTYTYTIANYFVLAAMLGVKNYGNRSIAIVRDNPFELRKVFWEIYSLQFWCSAVSLAVYVIFVLFFVSEYQSITLIQGIYVFSAMLDISWLFFGLEKFKITVTRNIIIRLISLLCIFLFVKEADDLWKYTLIMTLGIFFSQSYLWHYAKELVPWIRPKFSESIQHLRSELVLFVPVIAVSLYKMMAKIMLKQLSDVTQVGYYESADRVLNIPLGVITALGTVMLPRMSNLAASKDKSKENEYIHNSMLFAMFLASGMMFGISGIATDFVPIFFGEGYLPCIDLMHAMAPTIFFIAWANVLRTQYLIPNKQDHSYIISVILGAVINLVINALCIPHMQAMGAAIGTICAEAAVCICQTIMVRKQLDIKHYAKDTLPFLLCGIGMYFIIIGISNRFSNSVIGLCVEILLGGSLYAIAALLYFMLSHQNIVRGLFKKKH